MPSNILHHKFKIIREFKETDLEPINSFDIKSELCPKVWTSKKRIKEDLREKLLQIAKDFWKHLKLSAEISDIVLAGSLANYNWNDKYSDFDIHISVDTESIGINAEFLRKLFDMAKFEFETKHNIKIDGFPVEIYVEDINEKTPSGRYSLLKDKWLVQPQKVDETPDIDLILKKAKAIMSKIDILEEKAKTVKNPVNEIKIVDELKDKLKNGRNVDEGGEFSLGNLVFKFLRRNGYMGKLIELKNKLYDKQF